jgi:hypothetical protein
MKTRVVKVSKGYVPQVWKSLGKTFRWFGKDQGYWEGVEKDLTTLIGTEYQLQYCVVETEEEAQSILSGYKDKKDEESNLSN